MKIKALAASLGFLVVAAHAQVYRWTDADGVVHYTQTPPPAGAYEAVRPRAPAADTAGEAVDAGKALLQRADEAAKKRLETQAKAELEAEDAAKRCEAAKQNRALLDSTPPRRLMTTNEAGEPARMTVDEWEGLKARYQAIIDADCQS